MQRVENWAHRKHGPSFRFARRIGPQCDTTPLATHKKKRISGYPFCPLLCVQKYFFPQWLFDRRKKKRWSQKKLHHKACIKWIFFSTWSKVSWSISSHCYVDCRQLYYIVKAVHIRFDAPTVHQNARSSQLVGMERNVAEFLVSVSVMVVVCEPFYAHLASFVPRRQGWREKQQKYTRMNTIETNVDATLVWWCVGNIRDFLILSIEIYNLK